MASACAPQPTLRQSCDGSEVPRVTERRVGFCLNPSVCRHPGAGMEQARAPLATMENILCQVIQVIMESLVPSEASSEVRSEVPSEL
jgi:hypothetical protein